MSNTVVWRLLGNGTLTTTSVRVSLASSRSGVDVHDEGRFGINRSPDDEFPFPAAVLDDKFDVDVQLRPEFLSSDPKGSDRLGDDAATSSPLLPPCSL